MTYGAFRVGLLFYMSEFQFNSETEHVNDVLNGYYTPYAFGQSGHSTVLYAA
jgi:hypothetical protein